MTKRGRPFKSQPTQAEANKQPRLSIDEAVDDILPIAIAHKFKERLKDQNTAETGPSHQEDDKRKQRGKRVAHLYSRSTNEFLNCVKALTPRQRDVVHDLGFGAMLHFNIKEIPGYLAYWVLNSLNLARCEIPLCGGRSLTLDEEDVHMTLGFPRGPTLISRPSDRQTDFQFNDYLADRCGKSRYKMTAADIAKMIKEEVNGGPDFKRMFMFMIENAVIETPADGNLKPKVLHYEQFSDMHLHYEL